MLERTELAVAPARERQVTGPVGLLPGIGLCLTLTIVSIALQGLEEHQLGHPYIEALVVAILLGTALRSIWQPSTYWRSGIAFSAKQVLEVAVMMLGASISLNAIISSGALLLGAIAVTVAVSIAASFSLCRLLGLPVRLSILVACGNSICGNSAIAAVAPVIGADGDDIASSIAFTAILGVVMVLGLPLLIPLVGLSSRGYGILAGLTVYAVPQVLAATVPAGLVSTQIGTLVKLVRVLLLGPVVFALSLLAGSLRGERSGTRSSFSVTRLVPWFILGFVGLATLRSMGVIPTSVVYPVARTATLLTIVSMAALGLGVDIRVIGRVGGRVTAAVTLSLVILVLFSLMLIHFLHLGASS